jgi:hypothetical protein
LFPPHLKRRPRILIEMQTHDHALNAAIERGIDSSCAEVSPALGDDEKAPLLYFVVNVFGDPFEDEAAPLVAVVAPWAAVVDLADRPRLPGCPRRVGTALHGPSQAVAAKSRRCWGVNPPHIPSDWPVPIAQLRQAAFTGHLSQIARAS